MLFYTLCGSKKVFKIIPKSMNVYKTYKINCDNYLRSLKKLKSIAFLFKLKLTLTHTFCTFLFEMWHINKDNNYPACLIFVSRGVVFIVAVDEVWWWCIWSEDAGVGDLCVDYSYRTCVLSALSCVLMILIELLFCLLSL